MGDELNSGTEQATTGTQAEAAAVQAETQTAQSGAQSASTVGEVRAEEYKRLQGEYTRATQTLSSWNKIAEETGMTPEQVRAAIQEHQQSKTMLENLRQALGGQQQVDPLQNNIYAGDQDLAAVIERIVQDKMGSTIQGVQQMQIQNTAAVLKQTVASYVADHKDLGVTDKQLFDEAWKMGQKLGLPPDDPKLLDHAAVNLLGVGAIAAKAKTSGVQTYLEQTKANAQTGNTLQGGGSTATHVEAPVTDFKRNAGFTSKMVGILEAIEAGRK